MVLMDTADRRLAAISTGQRGAFTRDQATDIGLSDRQLRSRVQSGILDQIGPNSFRAAGGARSLRDDLSHLLLDVGVPVFVSGPTAAALHGFDGFSLKRPFHIVVPRSRNSRRVGVHVHTSGILTLLDQCRIDGIPTTSSTRTVIDLARLVSPAQLLAALESAIRDGGTSEDALHRRIGKLRTKGRFGIPTLLDIIDGREVARGGQSWLEREYLQLIVASGLPRPATQQVLTKARDRSVRVDCRFAGTNVVVELLGYMFHRSAGQMRRDSERVNALLADGFLPYQFTYQQVVGEPEYVVATTTRALAQQAAA